MTEEQKEIFDKATEMLEEYGHGNDCLLYGPAHVVWCDLNFEKDDIEFCIDDFNECKVTFSEIETAIIYWSLVELLKL